MLKITLVIGGVGLVVIWTPSK